MRKAEESLICLGTSLAFAVLEVGSLDVSNYFTSQSQEFRSHTKMANERRFRWGAQPEKTWLWACNIVLATVTELGS